MRKIFISAGHTNVLKPGFDNGASGNGFIEGLLTVGFRDLLVRELNLLGIYPIIDSNENALKASINFFKRLISPNSIALDIHWNSSENATATGTETLIPAVYTNFEYELASRLSEAVSKTLNIRTRGANGVKTELESHHSSLGWMRLNAENVLMEICFISNKSDMDKYISSRIQLAKNIALILKEYSSK